MARVNTDDYRTEGGVDWKALRSARIAAGEICSRCETPLFGGLLKEWAGGKRLCNSCKNMENDQGEVSHDTDLRCPKCGFLMNVNDYDLWESAIWEDGEHEIDCVECECKFTVTTNISLSFDSPARETED